MNEAWSLPADLPFTFVHERSHFSGPVRALDFALNVKAMEHGFNAALDAYQVPVRVIDLHLGGFVYEALVDTDPSLGEPSGALRPVSSLLEVAVDELPRLWPEDWLPAIQRHVRFWRGFDLACASDAAVAVHFEQTRTRALDLWTIHFRVFFPMLLAIRRFRALCGEIFDDWSVDDSVAVLSGRPSKTTEGDDVLWRLGQMLRADADLSSALAAGSWPDVRRALGALPSGRSFLDRLDAYLDNYGRRGRDWSIDRPFLVEDPTSVLAILRTYALDDGSAREQKRVAQEARRRTLEAAATRRLAQAPHPVRGAFLRLHAAARTATWLSEESYHWIEGLGSYGVRGVCLEVGRRLRNRGVLDHRDDVFHLQPDEVVQALRGAELEAIAAQAIARRNAFDEAGNVEPPPVLGPAEEASPAPTEIGEVLDLFFGAPKESRGEGDALCGHGASPGVARGPVRVVASLDEAARVQPGDVLVAHTTSPGWTPLFRAISGLVTDTGGVLCHAAVVAREYGLPAVVGVGDATRALADGQWVEVDGATGLVRRIEAGNDRARGSVSEAVVEVRTGGA